MWVSGFKDVEFSDDNLLLFLKDLVLSNKDLTSITVYKSAGDSALVPSTGSTASSKGSIDKEHWIIFFFQSRAFEKSNLFRWSK